MKNLRSIAWLGVVALIVSMGVARADDPWKSGDPKSWSKEDAMKVLQDSPWGKKVVTKMEYKKESSENKSTGGKRLDPETDRGDLQPTEWAMVVWWASRAPRQAFLRVFELNGGQPSEEQLKEFSERVSDRHIVVVWGAPGMMMFASRLTDEDLKKAGWLEAPRAKRVAPEQVMVVKNAKDAAERIVFIFPRQAEGQPVVTDQDKKVVFKFKLPQSKDETVAKAKQFEAQFQPSKMLFRNEPDI